MSSANLNASTGSTGRTILVKSRDGRHSAASSVDSGVDNLNLSRASSRASVRSDATSIRSAPELGAAKQSKPKRKKSKTSPTVPALLESPPPSGRATRPMTGAESCPFDEFGCTFSVRVRATTHATTIQHKRDNIRQHIKETYESHLDDLRRGVLGLQMELAAFTTEYDRHDRMHDDIVYRIGQLSMKFNSNMVWRIDRYSELVRAAKTGVRSIIFSPPFYSGRNGYYLAVSMALFGDGDCESCARERIDAFSFSAAKGEYNGIFLSVLRGDYDPLQHWPFLCPVTFTLIEQRNDELAENAVTVLRPVATKKNRPFLGRPTGERNPSFGVQKFVSLSDMKSKMFIRDDTIFVRVDIDTSDLPPI